MLNFIDGMPLTDDLWSTADHVPPVSHFCLPSHITPQQDMSYSVVLLESVVIHHQHLEDESLYVLPKDVKLEGLIEDWNQCLAFDGGLPLVNQFVVVVKPHLHVWICQQIK